MVSLRFPFSFPRPSKLPKPTSPPSTSSPRTFSAAVTVACAAVASAGAIAISRNPISTENPFLQNAVSFLISKFVQAPNHGLPNWCSLSLADNSAPVVESRTGVPFPSVLDDSKRLLGIGLRRKAVFGLKNINVYAFGVYADDGDVKKFLGEKYGKLAITELTDNKELNHDLMDSDICMTISIQVVYGRLSIGSVRSAFEESVGNRIQKFGGSENKELLQRFTSQFKDEYKIPKGSIINMARERGHVLRTTIDGKEVGSIESKLLCRSVLDLYIGDDPFDEKAKEDIKLNLASLLQT